MAEWEDVTSYWRGERGTVAPRTWELMAGNVGIVVTRHIHHDPDVWLLSCPRLGIELEPLSSTEVGAAKAEAVRLVLELVEADLAAVRAAVGGDGLRNPGE